MKRKTTALIAAAACFTLLFAFSSCDIIGEDHVHSYFESTIAPTCTENGYTVGVCLCGDIKVTDIVDPLGHEEGDVCYRCSTAGVEYALSEDGTSATVTAYAGEDADVYVAPLYKGVPVTSVAADAFGGGVVYVHLPASVATVAAGAFAACTDLEEIEADENSEHFRTASGVLYTKDGASLVCYPAARQGEQFAVPDEVTEIKPGAFSSSAVSAMVLPVGISRIGEGAFGSSLECVYYAGTAEQWAGLTVSLPQGEQPVAVYYFSEQQPTLGGNYWHYGEDGKPAIWE